jgi:pimeloyl-ACP methyl ester carboxylesterase
MTALVQLGTAAEQRSFSTPGGIHVVQRGSGTDILLIAGLGDPWEAWTAQLDALAGRYRVTAFDNRGAGRSPGVPDDYCVARMADDAAAVMAAAGVETAHVMGFSGGSAVAQEVALRHPGSVDSLVLVSTWPRSDAYFDAVVRQWPWMIDVAPSERAMLEAFFVWIYSPKAYASGMVDAIVEEALVFEHAQPPEQFKRQLAAFVTHDSYDRLPTIAVPTLVVAGEYDIITPPRLGRVVAERIPGAEFVVLPEEAHQPFQESPDEFNAMVEAFWQRVEAG